MSKKVNDLKPLSLTKEDIAKGFNFKLTSSEMNYELARRYIYNTDLILEDCDKISKRIGELLDGK